MTNKTLSYLSQNPKMAEKIQRIQNDKRNTIVVKVGQFERGNTFDPNTNTVRWDPTTGHKITEADGTETYTSPAAGLAHELIHGHNELYDKKAKEERKSPHSMPKSQREIWTDGEEKSVIEEVNEYNDDWAPHEGDRKSHRPANVERVRQRDPTAGPPPKPDPKPAEKQEAPKPEDDDTSDSDK